MAFFYFELDPGNEFCLHFPHWILCTSLKVGITVWRIAFSFNCNKVFPTKYFLGIVVLVSLYSHSYSKLCLYWKTCSCCSLLCAGCFLSISVLWTPHWWVMPFQHWFVASCILGVAWLYSTNSEKFFASVLKCGLSFSITASSYLLQVATKQRFCCHCMLDAASGLTTSLPDVAASVCSLILLLGLDWRRITGKTLLPFFTSVTCILNLRKSLHLLPYHSGPTTGFWQALCSWEFLSSFVSVSCMC